MFINENMDFFSCLIIGLICYPSFIVTALKFFFEKYSPILTLAIVFFSSAVFLTHDYVQ